MPNPALPQNQIGALPLQTPEQALQAGDALVYGSPITKFWDSVALGVTNQPASNANPLPAGSPFFSAGNAGLLWVIPTLFINTIGVGRFTLLLRRTRSGGSGAGAALALFHVMVQYRFHDPAEIPDVTRAAEDAPLVAKQYVNVTSYNFPGNAFPAMSAETTPQTLAMSWDPAKQAVVMPLALGSHVRFILNWRNTAPTPTVNDLWTAQLWGASI